MRIIRKQFREWLFTQPKDRIIEAGSTTNCFICSFLKETGKVTSPHLTYDEVSINGGPDEPLPKWVKSLIDCDECRTLSKQSNHFGPNKPISVKQMQERFTKLFK